MPGGHAMGRVRFGLASALLTCAVLAQGQDLAITHVTVIDTETGRAQRDMTVLISGERATIDTAAWTFYAPNFIASGVTGVRGMWDILPTIQKLRAEIASGRVAGPRIVTSGNMLDGARPSLPGAIACADAQQGRAAVDQTKREGSDFVKVYSGLSRDAYFAIADQSKEAGLPFAGHVPNSVTAAGASDAGQKSIEHLLGVFAACSSLRAAVPSYDSRKAAALFARFVKNGTWQTPTLAVLRSAAYFGDAEYMKDDRLSQLPPVILDFWKAGLTPLQALQAATLRPAEYLGMAERLGTISPGKLADLVLLSGDPLADIANTRRIEAVIQNGRIYQKPELQRMLGRGQAEGLSY